MLRVTQLKKLPPPGGKPSFDSLQSLVLSIIPFTIPDSKAGVKNKERDSEI